MKYYIWTIGCQYNEWDSARIRYIFDSLNFVETSAKEAKVIIILACAVRQTAVDRALGRLKNWKDKKVIVTGCVLKDDQKRFKDKGVDIVKAGDYKTLIKLIDKKAKISSKLLDLSTSNSKYIPIINGCNNFCSYCAVPYTRGREKSRLLKDILRDVKALIKSGHHEIMLLGQNVNSYKITSTEVIPHSMRDPKIVDSRLDPKGPLGSENDKTKDFTKLLYKLNDLDGDFKIAFVSNHPKDMTEDIIEAVATLPKIKKEIHLPLQSGSDKILKAMNRPYTKNKYLKIVENIKKISKRYKTDIILSTDAIVGFPGESEKDFQETKEVFKKVKFKYAFINKYSPRAGTKAHELGDPISWSEKQRRWRILNKISNN